MKKKFVTVISAAAVAGMLAGCSGELSNEYVTVTQYKGLEVPQASGSVEEVTDEQVDQMIEGTLSTYAEREEVTDRAAQEGTLPDMPLYRAAEVLHASGTAILPALHLDEFGQTAPAGTAVFANSQLTCFLGGSEIGGGDADA